MEQHEYMQPYGATEKKNCRVPKMERATGREWGILSFLCENAGQQWVSSALTKYLLEADVSENKLTKMSLKGFQNQTQAWNMCTTKFHFLKISTHGK